MIDTRIRGLFMKLLQQLGEIMAGDLLLIQRLDKQFARPRSRAR
jgi:hypothetical protein